LVDGQKPNPKNTATRLNSAQK